MYKLSQVSEYVKCVDNNKTMFLKVIDKGLIKRYIKRWERIDSLINKEFASQSTCGDNDKCRNLEIKSYKSKTNGKFQSKIRRKENKSYNFSPVKLE